MEIKEAIKSMKNIKKYWSYKPAEVNAAELAIQALENQLKDRWIPVSERLPEVRQDLDGEPYEFIVMIRNAKVPTLLSVDNNGDWFDCALVYYGADDYLSRGFDVIAWKPLPEPYKEVQ